MFSVFKRCTSIAARVPRVSTRSFLTAERYNLTRGNYAKLETGDLDFFRSILNAKDVVTDKDDIAGSNIDWMQKYEGQSKLLLKPRSTAEVSQVLKYCNERKLAVVPQGGNTGLVGGSVPVFDEIILSLANLNKIRDFDDVSGIFTADAGVVLQTADEWLRERGYIFPLDLGAKGSCHIGGNVATNAGGLRLLRYGSLHGTVLGVEAVLPNGEIFDGLNSLRKDNTGFDLKQLLIGSEGSIGIITAISIICPPKPASVNVAWLGVDSFESVRETFRLAKKHLGEILSAFECMDKVSMETVEVSNKNKGTPMQPPLEDIHPYQILIETSGSNGEHDEEKLNSFLEIVMENGAVSDGVVAQDETQIQSLWGWREGAPEASNSWGGTYKYDVSLPLPAMWELVGATQERLSAAGLMSTEDESKPVYAAIGYGHIGDGNLHLNVCVRRYDDQVEAALEPFVFEFVAKHQGSVSAEHGLGFQKVHALGYSKSPEMIKLMKGLKASYDPNWIMNPYKYLEA